MASDPLAVVASRAVLDGLTATQRGELVDDVEALRRQLVEAAALRFEFGAELVDAIEARDLLGEAIQLVLDARQSIAELGLA